MSKIGFVGMGRLGLPVALAWASKGHDVVGYDVTSWAKDVLASRKYPYLEPGAQKLLDEGVQVHMVDSVADLVTHADIVFVAVQTPHAPEYEGVTRVPATTADFGYGFLKSAINDVVHAAETQKKHVTMAVISTVLPGTFEHERLFNGSPYVSYVFAPMLIAQSTVVEDALNPEVVFLGVDRSDARGVEEIRAFFESMHATKKIKFMSVVTAEAVKMLYNTAISSKVVLANAWMEICHKTGADVDDVSDCLAMATDRIVSSRYMRGGMSEGGGCHPRDAIALAHLAERLDLSFDLGGMLASARERQTEWLAELVMKESNDGKLPIVILGKAYKRGTNITTGSPAILLANILREYPHLTVDQWDPHVDGGIGVPGTKAAVYIIATDHDEFFAMRTFPSGSVVIDPWGKMPDIDSVNVIRVGRT